MPNITVEVVYALPTQQHLLQVQVPEGTTARQLVALSGLMETLQAPHLAQAPLGLFGEAFGTKGLPAAEAYCLQAGDRVEIYRPLVSDPKEVRRRRAAKLQAGH